MIYRLLIASGSTSVMVALFLDLWICGFVQFLHEIRGKTIPDTNRLFIILIFPLWTTIWCIFYYVLKLFMK